MSKLSIEERCRVLGQAEAGRKVASIAEQFQITRQAVYNLIRKYTETGNAKDLPKSGRPPVINHEQSHNIVQMHEQNPFKTATLTAREIGASRQSVVRRLNRAGLKAHRPAVRPLLTDINKTKRLEWARKHIRWTLDDWSGVLFSDEATFEIDSVDRRLRCYRRVGERFDEDKIKPLKNRGYGTVMVWGGIVGRTKTPLVRINGRLRADDYIEQVLEAHVVPLFHNNNVPVTKFMQDNAPPHRAIVTRHYLETEQIPVLDWPSVSPDMNPIENVWSHMKRQLKEYEYASNADNLFEILRNIWEQLPEEHIQNLTKSMGRRVRVLYDANGSYTKY